jgi:hypothetical protein
MANSIQQGYNRGLWLVPPLGVCCLEGYKIECHGRLTGQHILNKSKARGNPAVRAILVACPDEIMAQVCEAHNISRVADERQAQRILLTQKIYRFGYPHMAAWFDALPWKVLSERFTLEGILA